MVTTTNKLSTTPPTTLGDRMGGALSAGASGAHLISMIGNQASQYASMNAITSLNNGLVDSITRDAQINTTELLLQKKRTQEAEHQATMGANEIKSAGKIYGKFENL